MCPLCDFGISAFTASAAIAAPLFARRGDGATSSKLPPRGEFVVTNAYVLTMDPRLGEIADCSVHVRDGVIVGVGRDLAAPGVKAIDGRDMIVLPGLIDTHWHMWQTLYRCFAGDQADKGFFPTITRFSAHMTPQDMYASARLSAAEALHCGITTVHDWCHNVRSREHPEGDLRALADVGIRTHFSIGQRIDQPDDTLMPLDIVKGVHADWKYYANDGLISLGMAWRGMFRNSWAPPAVYRPELEFARGLGLPISVHIGTLTSRTGHVTAHFKEKLLGPDVNIVHACSASPDEIRMIKDTGASVSILSLSEMRGGWGLPLLTELLDAGIPAGLGVDSVGVVGNCNMFGLLKFAAAIENGKTLNEFKFTPRRMLSLGTIEAAKILGIDDKVGSLTPGKRADIVMVSTDALNMAPYTDPANMLIESAQPENVDTVVVDGRILKEGGRLTAIETGEVVREARQSLQEVRKRAAWK